jgi:DNA-binding MarR family transcriptional regulator
VTPITATPPVATGLDVVGSAADLDRLRVVVLRIARRIRTSSPEAITASQASTLGTIMRHGPCTIGFIADIEHMQAPSASKIVSTLEQRGLVARQADPADRRCSRMVITQAGQQVIDDAREAGRGWLASRLPDLNDDEVATLGAAIPALERLLGSYDEGNPTPVTAS